MTLWLRQSTARTIHIGPFVDSSDGNTVEDGLTISQADVRLSKNGGDIAQKNDATGCTHDELGYYTCPLSTTDTGTLGHLKLMVHESGALPVWMDFMVVPSNVWDSMFGTDKLEVDATLVEGGDATNAIRDALVDDATRIDASALNTLSGHDPGETIMGATDLGTGTGLTAIPWNASWDAEVQSECADALAAYDPPTAAELTNGLAALNDLDAAGVRSAVGMASANLDTQRAALPTEADVQTAAGAALASYDPPTKAELDAADDAVLAAVAALNDFDPAADTVAHVTLVDTTTTNTDMVAAAPAASAVADAVWDEPLAGHAGAGSAGAALSAASAPSAADVADAVWDETVADHSGVGSTGAALAAAGGSGDPWATAVPGAYGAGTAGNIVGNLNDVSSGDVQTAAAAALTAYDPPTATELTNGLAALNDLDAAGVRGAVGLAAADLDTQLAGLPTDADVETACEAGLTDYGAAKTTDIPSDYATAAAVTALNDLASADAQAAAAAALTAYDPPTRTEATSDKDEVLAAMPEGSDAPTAGEVADAVWDEALVDHAVAGSTGAAVTAAGVAGDPWTAELPGDYAAGTAGAVLPQLAGAIATLGAGQVTVTSPVASSGAITIYQGDDYDAIHGRGIVFAVADAEHALGLDEATVRLKCTQASWTATSVTPTGEGYSVTFEPTRADTAALTIAKQGYELEATLADGDVVTLATGVLELRRDIPRVN